LFISLVLAVCLVPSTGAAAPSLPVWDDFSAGFSVGPVGSNAKWFYFATPDGAFVGDDGNTFTADSSDRAPFSPRADRRLGRSQPVSLEEKQTCF
jgi:hypothetical protein